MAGKTLMKVVCSYVFSLKVVPKIEIVFHTVKFHQLPDVAHSLSCVPPREPVMLQHYARLARPQEGFSYQIFNKSCKARDAKILKKVVYRI